jgi:hypothetical protein
MRIIMYIPTRGIYFRKFLAASVGELELTHASGSSKQT